MKGHIKIVASTNIAPAREGGAQSRMVEVVRLSALLVVSIGLWAAVIWYCVVMWNAR